MILGARLRNVYRRPVEFAAEWTISDRLDRKTTPSFIACLNTSATAAMTQVLSRYGSAALND
jgi:hypothetical protein